MDNSGCAGPENSSQLSRYRIKVSQRRNHGCGLAGGITILQAWAMVLLIVWIVIAILVAAIIRISSLAVYETAENQTKKNAVESGFLEKMKVGLKYPVETFGGDIGKAVVGTKESIIAEMKGQSREDSGD